MLYDEALHSRHAQLVLRMTRRLESHCEIAEGARFVSLSAFMSTHIDGGGATDALLESSACSLRPRKVWPSGFFSILSAIEGRDHL